MTDPVEGSPHAWRRNQQSDETRARELLAEECQLARAERRLLAETLLGCVTCCGVGLFLVGWAIHTTDATLGGIAFWSGLLIGDVGMVSLLVRHYHRSDAAGI
jgi:hypothetical protein